MTVLETQVVTIATYSYFVACTMGRQYLNPDSPAVDNGQLDLYFPGFTALEFIFLRRMAEGEKIDAPQRHIKHTMYVSKKIKHFCSTGTISSNNVS